MVSLWLFVAVCIVAVLLFVCVILLWNNLLPWPDRGSFIFTCLDDDKRHILMGLLVQHKDQYNFFPRFRADDPSGKILRAIYPSGMILNVVDSQTLAGLGKPGCGFAIPTNTPKEDAHRAVQYLRKHGDTKAFASGPHEDGKVWLVPTDLIVGGGVIIFRLPIHKMDKPPKWIGTVGK